MNRVTQKDLENLCLIINRAAGTPEEPYRREGTKFVGNIGNYHLDGAYGGWKLVQIDSDGGGIRNATDTGFVPKRECLAAMRAFLNGLNAR